MFSAHWRYIARTLWLTHINLTTIFNMLIRLIFSAVGAVVGVQLIRAIFKFLSWRLYSPFRYMPGPPNPSWIYGNFGSVTVRESILLNSRLDSQQSLFRRQFPRTQEWQTQYGPTFRFDGLFSVSETKLFLFIHGNTDRSIR